MISKPVQNSEFPAFQALSAHLPDLAWAASEEVFMIGSYFPLLVFKIIVCLLQP